MIVNVHLVCTTIMVSLVAQNDENYSLSYTVVHTEIANGQFEDYTLRIMGGKI